MTSRTELTDLIILSQNRWTVPLLADLAAHHGARFVELLHRLKLPRDSLVRTLELAKEYGWVIPNPGHGHPLRPEYILTESGQRMAAAASSLFVAQCQINLSPVQLTRWSVPLLRVISEGENRFNSISRSLPLASPRAISQGLRSLSEVKLAEREIIDEYPPISIYTLTANGALLANAA